METGNPGIGRVGPTGATDVAENQNARQDAGVVSYEQELSRDQPARYSNLAQSNGHVQGCEELTQGRGEAARQRGRFV